MISVIDNTNGQQMKRTQEDLLLVRIAVTKSQNLPLKSIVKLADVL